MNIISIIPIMLAAAVKDIQANKQIILPDHTAEQLTKASQTVPLEWNINKLVDDSFAQLRRYVKSAGYDPASIDDYRTGFKYGIFKGTLVLTNGKLQNVSTLKRAGSVQFDLKGSSIEVRVPAGFTDLSCSYQYSAKLLGIGPTGSLYTKVQRMKLNTVLNIEPDTNIVTLANFKVLEAGPMSIEFRGSSMDWFLNWLSNKYKSQIRDKIITKVEEAMNKLVKRAAD